MERIIKCHVCKGTACSPEKGKKCQCGGSGKLRAITISSFNYSHIQGGD